MCEQLRRSMRMRQIKGTCSGFKALRYRGRARERGQAGLDRLNEARDQQADIFDALDGLVQGIEGGLETAGKISGARSRIGEQGTLADAREDDISKTVGDQA